MGCAFECGVELEFEVLPFLGDGVVDSGGFAPCAYAAADVGFASFGACGHHKFVIKTFGDVEAVGDEELQLPEVGGSFGVHDVEASVFGVDGCFGTCAPFAPHGVGALCAPVEFVVYDFFFGVGVYFKFFVLDEAQQIFALLLGVPAKGVAEDFQVGLLGGVDGGAYGSEVHCAVFSHDEIVLHVVAEGDFVVVGRSEGVDDAVGAEFIGAYSSAEAELGADVAVVDVRLQRAIFVEVLVLRGLHGLVHLVAGVEVVGAARSEHDGCRGGA